MAIHCFRFIVIGLSTHFPPSALRSEDDLRLCSGTGALSELVVTIAGAGIDLSKASVECSISSFSQALSASFAPLLGGVAREIYRRSDCSDWSCPRVSLSNEENACKHLPEGEVSEYREVQNILRIACSAQTPRCSTRLRPVGPLWGFFPNISARDRS